MRARYLTLSDAARRLGCSGMWAAHLFDTGALVGMRDSSGRRPVTEGSVERLLRRREAKRARGRAHEETPAPALAAAAVET